MGTKNQNLAAKSYEKQFLTLLQAVFGAQSYFGDFFAGGLEARDGIQDNETAFYVKTTDIPVVIGDGYDTGEEIAFESGTGKSSRFGERKEITYEDTPVPYTWGWNFHEGIDRFTVNNDEVDAVADRLELQAQAKTKMFNRKHSEFISESAEKTITLEDLTSDGVAELFNDLAAYFTNIEAQGNRVAKVNTSLYNALVDSNLATGGKGSTVSIDGNDLPMFKGFGIQAIPDELFSTKAGEAVAYVYIPSIGKAFTGINTARTIESEDFDGKALQGAGKAGEFILDDNKKAVVKVSIAPSP